MSEPVFIQIILAAGRSRRMGRPKALLPFGETTALELVVRAGRSVAAWTRLVVSPEGVRYPDVLPPDLSVDLVVNPAAEAEPIDSLRCGLAASPLPAGSGVFVHPVDVPLVTASVYRVLARAFREDAAQDFDVFKPGWEGARGHPVLMRGRVVARLLEDPPPASLREALREFASRSVAVASRDVLEDMDTPEDHERLVARFRARAPGDVLD